MSDLKRDVIKYVRDRAKKAYKRGNNCYICSVSDTRLDFHHYNSLTALFDKWLKDNGLEITCEDDILHIRDEFIATHTKEIYDDTVTLCKAHHDYLHKIYGQKPALLTAPKQKNWVEKQREKVLAKHGT